MISNSIKIINKQSFFTGKIKRKIKKIDEKFESKLGDLAAVLIVVCVLLVIYFANE